MAGVHQFNLRSARRLRALGALALLGAFLSACGKKDAYKDKLLGMPVKVEGGDGPAADAGTSDGAVSVPTSSALCRPAVAADSIPARDAVLVKDTIQSSTDQGVFTKALFDEFKRHCGDCHAGSAGHGGLSVDLSTFSAKIGADALARMRSDTPGVGGFMPPAPQGIAFSARPAGDSLRAFADRLEQWIAQGSPADVFFPEGEASSGPSGDNLYLVSREVGMQMTNLGNCIPTARMMTGDGDKTSADQRERAEALDKKFAALERFEDLPKNLRDTDVFTLDSQELARYGVVAFAPAYTLWADDAKKIRMMRVPRGTSIAFDKARQTFDIPANTRFYKTFLKETIDLNGSTRYRKMETRLILARPATRRADGAYEQTALFGTYRWNEAETEATLVDTPYRDGKGFVDTVFPYVVDERLDDEVLRTGPENQLAARLEAGSMRNYAVPGFDRCVHCHMGSPMQNFVLGFIPLQIRRRPLGEGGVIEEAKEDELNQLQRLIDYGLISGMASPDDVVPLEQSQGDREPRNEHELDAQGYLLGNCAHCHNPDGFPSIKEAVLKDALNFLPGEDGGIFQFPLEKYSPRTFRGVKQDIPVPYITPSLYDLHFDQVSPGINWSAFPIKWVVDAAWEAKLSAQDSKGQSFWGFAKYPIGLPLYAPWRSLIYRNVDAPFSYEEAGTVFPHMPLDTPGYDCRARRVLGKWMVSIPARWKSDGKTISLGNEQKTLSMGFDEAFHDPEPQPYSEVTPDDPEFAREVRLAASRVKKFEEGERYNDCPAPTLDVLDPVVAATGIGLPAPQRTEVRDDGGEVVGSYSLRTPARSHYFETDLRSNTSWIIRRGDWYEILVEGRDDPYVKAGARTIWARVSDALQQARVEPVRALALEQVPFGLWVDKKECAAKFERAGVARAGSYSDAGRPSWMEYAPELTPESPVYATSRGAQVFEMICSKCHGPAADGQSSLASTMADLTGGLTRVANLRDGIFGPVDDPGANRRDPVVGFGRAGGTDGLSVDDWAARYVVWMGLGGTRANIPKAAVATVGRSEVLGVRSGIEINFENLEGSEAGNMLEIAKLSCQELVPDRPNPVTSDLDTDILFDPTRGQLVRDPQRSYVTPSVGRDNQPNGRGQQFYSLAKTGLVTTNGHAELWDALCRVGNPLPVRLVSFETTGEDDFFYVSGLYRRSAYPPGDRVGDDTGPGGPGQTLRPENAAPWCVVRPTHPELAPAFEQYLERTGQDLPLCSDAVASLDAAGRIRQGDNSSEGDDDVERWAIRGAMNAGMAVFVYLDALSKGEVSAKPAYNHCEELAP